MILVSLSLASSLSLFARLCVTTIAILTVSSGNAGEVSTHDAAARPRDGIRCCVVRPRRLNTRIRPSRCPSPGGSRPCTSCAAIIRHAAVLSGGGSSFGTADSCRVTGVNRLSDAERGWRECTIGQQSSSSRCDSRRCTVRNSSRPADLPPEQTVGAPQAVVYVAHGYNISRRRNPQQAQSGSTLHLAPVLAQPHPWRVTRASIRGPTLGICFEPSKKKTRCVWIQIPLGPPNSENREDESGDQTDAGVGGK